MKGRGAGKASPARWSGIGPKGLPYKSRLTGKVTLGAWRGRPAAYFRMTQATSADGKTKGPVCLCAVERLDSNGKVDPNVVVHPVERYFHRCDGADI